MSTPTHTNGIYIAHGTYNRANPGYLEKHLQNAIKGYLVRLGWLVMRINQGAAKSTYKGKPRYIQFATWHASGLPQAGKGLVDLICLDAGGRVWAIDCKKPNEVKSPGALYNKLTPTQEAYLLEVHKRNGVAVVCDNLDALTTLINEVING